MASRTSHGQIVAESLVEFKTVDKLDFSRSKGKCGGDKDQDKEKNKDKDKPSNSGSEKPLFCKWKSLKNRDKKEREPQACFLCDEPHRMWDYLKRGKLATIAKNSEAERKTLKLGSIMLNSIKTKRLARHKRLMFIDITVVGNKMNSFGGHQSLKLVHVQDSRQKAWLGHRERQWVD